jgi:hypothetical protein
MRSRFLNSLALLLFGASLSFANPTATEKGRTIDVAVLLDTSGSMDGLIESAKIKLWTIVNDLAKIQPTPNLRVALYQYGNDGISRDVAWVKKEVDLTVDLDEVYKKLNVLRTNGGTELVARVTRDALRDLKWTDEKDALKMIFVCGNEPADQDKEVTLSSIADMAKKQGVFVNTIYCGPKNSHEVSLWKEFAQMCGGKYANIDQDRAQSEVTIQSPFDKELLEFSSKLNTTYFCYGQEGKDKQANQKAQDANAAKTSPTANLERSSTKASGLYRNAAWDILDRMKEDPKFDIKKLKEEELDDELKKIKPEEREAFLKKKAAEREEIRKKIQDLSAKRAKYVAEEMKKQPKSDADKSFDEAVKACVREQAASKGIKIPE